ncbi:uncharacterized protein SPPG_08780 [Spizellomyces punctatus DAOM BR117]|uniref:DNA mismatch repair protein MSH3 n=1 Tax=Spizellomyces punctatus (strain DAOM BR117) TaxID=645134 RepID=A0A0L0H3Q5_SPIPD|nr:uncharacterized protein SPPG_08780 [Spizellomyces punctatus DAOM BR117]KNC95837.1 hypothetical protein SPPG_08780 [Spizellomyces punctatus DAOM BR117]|eukprot:XP_016603877.1 hypothetical protein SPPG_08780 [Spizellomyces punctatus DAOM BR117]
MSGKRKATADSGGNVKKLKSSGTSFQQRTISSFFTPKTDTSAPRAAKAMPSRDARDLLKGKFTENDENRQNDSPGPCSPNEAPRAIEQDAAVESGNEGGRMEVDSPSPKLSKFKRLRRLTSDSEEELPGRTRPAAKGGTIPRRSTEAFRYRKKNHACGENTEGENSQYVEVSGASAAERNRVRERFLAKFTIDERSEDPNPEADEGDMDSAEDGEVEHGTGKGLPRKVGNQSRDTTPVQARKGSGKTKSTYTPLEQQFLEIKANHPDCLLVVEVGYKFRFFGEDAKIAAKELNIVAYRDHSMYTASFPTHRLHVHVKKLVQLGYKVGIVRQMETAALKAVGDNKNAPFVRKLTNVYSKGTFVDDIGGEDIAFEVRSSYLLCINEEEGKGAMDTAKISIVAVQLHTGDVIFDEFDDNYMRNELETRMMHIQPTEIILPGNPLSDMTETLIRQLCESFGSTGDTVRIERLKGAFLDHATARKVLAEFYEQPILDNKPTGNDNGTALAAELYSQALSLPRRVIICLAALLKYLVQFGLEDILRLTKFFTAFASVAHMVLNANTLNSLEIFRNQTDFEEKGSLLWILDHTKTKFGQRLLKKWIGRPLVQLPDLQKRIDAVEEIIQGDAQGNVFIQRMRGLICQLPDLEKSVCRIHYGRCSPSELNNTLLAFEKIGSSFISDAWEKFRSPILKDIYKSLPAIKSDVMYFRGMINESAAKSDDKIEFFSDTSKWPEIGEFKENLETVEEELLAHLKEVRGEIKKPNLTYVTVAGIEYLIEVPVNQASKVPSNWIKISNTKAVARFHTPFVIEKIKERDRYREQLVAACDTAYAAFVREVGSRYELFRGVVQSIATMDCLLSLATVAAQPGYCKPEFVPDATVLVKEGRHPMVENVVSSYVTNDVDLTQDRRCLLITGPNMGGKSSYIRQVALIVIMGQIGSYVPAKSAQLGIFDSVHTRMGASDDLAGGQSTFMKELQETSDIMRTATNRSLVILDELGRGTSTHDGTAIAFATLKYFIEDLKSITLFVTHYPVLGQLEKEFPGALRNCHMAFHETEEEDESSHSIIFLYKLTRGLAHRSYGLNVARLANLPNELLATAREKAAELEAEVEQRKTANSVRTRADLLLRFWRETFAAHDFALIKSLVDTRSVDNSI